MRTLLVISVALFLVVACMQVDAIPKAVPIPEDPSRGKSKGTAAISARRLLNDDGDDTDIKNTANGESTTNSATGGENHRYIINAHPNPPNR
ncbi:hypothetical protein PanWU01x14_121080 [Parasponia andersonii]|uniref:Transmembrane protein n=1 Tax=Parasponia andersonii TaxID=3476 RepID=A0A2P5CVC1_PARAD|nr:hypothetical protein PanWU01x14_121080 [Parasponia andersonii]